jgi:predicted O-methyltransferase YrrM
LENTGRLGFSEGISKIFIDGLKQINVNDRPLHCSDLKRETLYIKDNNEWNKESEQKTILTNAIKHVSHKNMKQITEWTKLNPEYKDSSSKVNDKYLKIVSEAMSGVTEEETNKNYSKIIKNIIKETVIDKVSH